MVGRDPNQNFIENYELKVYCVQDAVLDAMGE